MIVVYELVVVFCRHDIHSLKINTHTFMKNRASLYFTTQSSSGRAVRIRSALISTSFLPFLVAPEGFTMMVKSP